MAGECAFLSVPHPPLTPSSTMWRTAGHPHPDMKDKLSGLAGQVVEFDGTAECAEDDFKPQLQSTDPP